MRKQSKCHNTIVICLLLTSAIKCSTFSLTSSEIHRVISLTFPILWHSRSAGTLTSEVISKWVISKRTARFWLARIHCCGTFHANIIPSEEEYSRGKIGPISKMLTSAHQCEMSPAVSTHMARPYWLAARDRADVLPPRSESSNGLATVQGTDKTYEQLSRKFFTSILQPSSSSSYPFTYSLGSYNYNSIKICKQISMPPQPYQKIPDIYFLSLAHYQTS